MTPRYSEANSDHRIPSSAELRKRIRPQAGGRINSICIDSQHGRMRMDAILLQILNGLDKGGAYALIALGLTLVFGTLGVVNFAHGALFMLGALVLAIVGERGPGSVISGSAPPPPVGAPSAPVPSGAPAAPASSGTTTPAPAPAPIETPAAPPAGTQ